VVLVAALVVSLASVPVAEAGVSQRVKAQIVRLVKPLVRDTRRLPRQVSRFSKRRSHRQAGVAVRAARKGRWCAVAAALGQIDRLGRARRHAARAERSLRRHRLARRCTQKAHRPKSKPAGHKVSLKGPPGVPRRRPAENDQGDGPPPLPISPQRPRHGGRGPVTPGEVDETAPTAPPGASGRRALPAPGLPPSLRSPFALSDPVAVFTRTELPDPGAGNGDPLDPSVATAGKVVIVTGNLYYAFSKDAGKTFKYLNPVTDIYKTDNPDGGACCDQVVHYDAATNRFYWLLQYWCTVQTDCKKRPGTNRIRIAEASPERLASTGGRGWTYYDFLSTDFEPAGNWIDFPDMAVGQSFLYVTINCPSCSTKTTSGAAIWMRLRKDQLAAGGSLDWPFIATNGDYIYKPVQNTRRTGYVVRRSGTAELEVKRWPDSATSARSDKVAIGSVPTQDCRSPAPDGRDFLTFQGCAGFSSSIGGAAMAGGGSKPGNIWVAWTSGERGEGTKDKNGNDLLDGTKTFPRPHIELAVLDPNSLDLLDQPAIWNPDYAFAYPYLAGGPSGEVALTYMAGNGKQYPGWGVGLLTGNRSIARVATGTVGAGRMGDYLAVRPAWPSKKLWAATGNVRTTTGSSYDPYYAVFGRKGDAPPRPVVINRPPPRLFPDLAVDALGNASFTVRNHGNVAARAFSVSLSGAGGPQTFRFASGLAAGASATMAFTCEAGTRTATADSAGEVAESDETDNARTAATACGPDLVISALTRTSFTVTNQGTAPAGGFYVSLSNSDNPYQFNNGLAAGASASQAFNCLDLPRTATADKGQDVAESDETNNTRSIPASGCG
jgi:hypothetical protein